MGNGSIYDDNDFFIRYQKLRQNPDSLNERVEKETMFSLLPPLLGCDLLDLGCGMGEHLVAYLQKGAKSVVGIDLSQEMLQVAQANLDNFCQESGREQVIYSLYPCAMEKLSDLNLAKMDVITSSFAFHYVDDLACLLAQIYHQLKPNGYVIFSQEHPIVTCHQGGKRWIKDGQKRHLAYRLAYYRDEGIRERNWFQQLFSTYHRRVSTIINMLIQQGFIIEEIREPMLEDSPHWQAYFPDLQHRPVLLFVKARRS